MVQCPICDSTEAREFFHLRNSPLLQNVLFDTARAARAVETVDIPFHYCGACHLVFNPQFRAVDIDYESGYDNDQLQSPYYREYLEQLIGRLVETTGIGPRSKILEIGCGSGYLLSRLRRSHGCTDLLGYDPAYRGQHGLQDVVRKEYFQGDLDDIVDLVICRHCFEAMPNFWDVVRGIERIMAPGSQVYIETPNLDYILTSGDTSLLCHEDAYYFSPKALGKLFERIQVEVRKVDLLFGDNYIGVYGRYRPDPSALSERQEQLVQLVKRHRKTLVWGASTRAISVLSHLGLDSEDVAFAVDIDEKKQGRYLPVSGHEILGPDQAKAYAPDLVIVSNLNYLNEIAATLHECDCRFCNLQGEIVTPGGPP